MFPIHQSLDKDNNEADWGLLTKHVQSAPKQNKIAPIFPSASLVKNVSSFNSLSRHQEDTASVSDPSTSLDSVPLTMADPVKREDMHGDAPRDLFSRSI
ncbi:hypothetical protein JTE90_000067 [Oedothorax gibbosus]|uniref:Uncharacterized protein n=1 Tax=Oedothorax gibbosus TaxID=931172 RepID=A0AAV6UEF8_9ARAC|nr:hypothetical protein JTE90_000067 [Oedothorax gibbosus]